MFVHLEQALVALALPPDPAQPKRLMSRLRRLLARAQPGDAEVDNSARHRRGDHSKRAAASEPARKGGR